ncbi:hypothetical protein DVH05_026643 [Phytophthora capsici]|nr:hypothetical protein DVH05_026643 [Phytophthora capsici]
MIDSHFPDTYPNAKKYLQLHRPTYHDPVYHPEVQATMDNLVLVVEQGYIDQAIWWLTRPPQADRPSANIVDLVDLGAPPASPWSALLSMENRPTTPPQHLRLQTPRQTPDAGV